MGFASSISPAIMGSSRNSIPRRVLPTSVPSSASFPLEERRLISGNMTLVMDSTRIPVIMVYRVLAYSMALAPAPENR